MSGILSSSRWKSQPYPSSKAQVCRVSFLIDIDSLSLYRSIALPLSSYNPEPWNISLNELSLSVLQSSKHLHNKIYNSQKRINKHELTMNERASPTRISDEEISPRRKRGREMDIRGQQNRECRAAGWRFSA